VALDPVRDRLSSLSALYDLPPAAVDQFEAILQLLRDEPASVTSVRDPGTAADVPVADSLVGLEVEAVRNAGTIADLGSGGGFPGIALAVALPAAHVALVESVSRKCAFLERAAEEAGLTNVEVVCSRAEEWANGTEANDIVTARALGPLNVLAEYAAPLLRMNGCLVAWKAARDDEEERDGNAAAQVLGLELAEIRPVTPFPTAAKRHLYVYSKVSSTPNDYPRRPGIARKRPLRSSG
jgi:16S rRNA (guanine527-N7)-methyltransferase